MTDEVDVADEVTCTRYYKERGSDSDKLDLRARMQLLVCHASVITR